MNPVQQTIELQRNEGFNCAQAIITAFGAPYGITPEDAKLFGRPWGGGMGSMAKTCGYLTGAVHVIARAFHQEEEAAARQETALAVRDLFSRFEAKRGSSCCRDLLGADMSTAEGRETIRNRQLVARICSSEDGIGRDVAGILAEILGAKA